MLTDEPFENALRSFETCVLVNNNLCGKLISSLESPTTFDGRCKVTLVSFFIADFNLLSRELDNFTFNVHLILHLLSHFILNEKTKLEYFYSSL